MHECEGEELSDELEVLQVPWVNVGVTSEKEGPILC